VNSVENWLFVSKEGEKKFTNKKVYWPTKSRSVHLPRWHEYLLRALIELSNSSMACSHHPAAGPQLTAVSPRAKQVAGERDHQGAWYGHWYGQQSRKKRSIDHMSSEQEDYLADESTWQTLVYTQVIHSLFVPEEKHRVGSKTGEDARSCTLITHGLNSVWTRVKTTTK
jgi:hypothetical protein